MNMKSQSTIEMVSVLSSLPTLNLNTLSSWNCCALEF